jgi:hypothetical protein
MKTIIQGKNLLTTYEVDHKWETIKNEKKEDITVFTGKPELVKKTEIVGWEDIKEFDENIELNKGTLGITSGGFYWTVGTINLTEDEVVSVVEKITRIDLGAYVLHTDKVLSEKELSKEDSEDTLKALVHEFNKQMIESNEGLLAYCNLLKLDPRETDVDELFKLVYPNKKYEIEKGKLLVKDRIMYTTWDDVKITTASNLATLTSTSQTYNKR